MTAPRVLFLGMLGAFSREVCEAALAAGVHVCGVIVPEQSKPGSKPGRLLKESSSRSILPILNPYIERNVVHLAWDWHIPVFATGDLRSAVELLGVQPDVMALACWPRLVPRSVRERVGLAVNVHPSLLPENRGPEPLFWTFRLGQSRTGVTVHLLEDRADSGAVLAQREVPIPDGIEGAELELRLASAGGELLADVVSAFTAGSLRPVPQDEAQASYHAAPRPEDWLIPAGWSEQRESNFRRGVAHLKGPLPSG